MDEKMKNKLLEALKAKGYSDEDAEAFINELTSEDEPVKDEVEEAEKNIEEKGEDTQTEKDRVDESVGEQIEEKGEGDSQSTKDRMDESEGEEKAEKEKKDPSLSDMNEVEEPVEEKTEKTEEEPKRDAGIEALKAEIETLKSGQEDFKTALLELQKTVEKLSQKPVPVPESQKTKLDKITSQYNN